MNVFLKHSHVLVAGRGATGSMVDAVLDYIRMLFHIDLIKFNSMLEMAEKIEGKIEESDPNYRIFGQYDQRGIFPYISSLL